MLEDTQIEQFVEYGFVRVDDAFPREVADECRNLLWSDVGCDPDDPATWTKPVVWLGAYSSPPFRQAANSPRLTQAFDQLVGPGCWQPMTSLGAFPVRFPTDSDTGDTGWHIDAAFPGQDSTPDDYLTWHVNLWSKGRALFALFLFSDVGEDDAPTRIRVGSHLSVVPMLAPHGEDGLRVTAIDYDATSHCRETLATGSAGTAYLCHPFLVHAAQINRGVQPRFMAQPPLLPSKQCHLEERKRDTCTPVERAIRRALGKSAV